MSKVASITIMMSSFFCTKPTRLFNRYIHVKQKNVLVADMSRKGNSFNTKRVVSARVVEYCFVARKALNVSIDIPDEEEVSLLES